MHRGGRRARHDGCRDILCRGIGVSGIVGGCDDLAPSAEYIEAVEVLGVPIRYSAGRYEVTMEGSELARNRNANELLGLLPGITTYDGLRLHGKSVGIVYIDDRRVEDRDELAALRAEDIEKVSVQNRAGASTGFCSSSTIRRGDGMFTTI